MPESYPVPIGIFYQHLTDIPFHILGRTKDLRAFNFYSFMVLINIVNK